MSAPLLVGDLFCGAGGSSTGAKRALERLGLRMQLVAVNHWNVAIATHQRNHPEAAHLCVDVYRTKPRDAVPGGRLDLLMASPTCTFFSRARGGRPISRDQRFGRMTPTQVVRWVTELDVRCLLVENVPEFQDWGPVSRVTGTPIKEKKGVYFRAWVRKLEALGYAVEWKILNAADHGDATTRKRFFLLARKDGEAIVWPSPTHSKNGEGGLPRWRPAREVIDWSLRGRSIFDRKRPLSRKTLARILAGAMKFNWPEPFLVILRRHMDGQSLDGPLPTVTAGGTHIGLAEPIVFQVNQGEDRMRNLRSADEPLQTVVTRPSLGVAEPLVLPQGQGGAARPVGEPMATITCDGAHALISPYYGSGSGETCGSAADPLPTCTTKARFGLVVPTTHEGDLRSRSVDDPLPTVTGANRGELAFIAAAFGERPTQAPRVHGVDAPAPTICAGGRIQLVEGEVEGRRYDILFRMLQPHELAGAMGFNTAEARYEFCGNKTEVIKQVGNAVPVRTASALVGALMAPASAPRLAEAA